MAYRDLREFLEKCRAAKDLVEIDRRVGLDLEVGKALKKTYARSGPVLLFKDTGTPFPAVGAVFGDRGKALRAFEAAEEDIQAKFAAGLARPIAPVFAADAPCQEVVLTGADIDLTQLPIPKFSPLDGGPYLTAGISVSKDPETNVPDIGHYRFQVLGKDVFGFMAQPFHRLGKHCNKARRRSMDTYEIAVVVGTDPVLGYACQVQAGDGDDDWAIAGGLRGEPVELVKCKTIDLEVPAYAEFVFELEIDFKTQRLEGPLGEYTGYITPGEERPVARVKAITHRHSPLFQILLTGKPVTENHILKNLPFEVSFYRQMQRQFPTLTAIAITPSGGVQLYLVLALRPRYAGEARHAILAAMASNIRPKWVVAVDPDIDVHSSAEVEWAMAFRVDPARDTFVIDLMPSAPLDPSSSGPTLQAKVNSAIGVDATLPFGGDFARVADVPGWREYQLPELDG